VGQGGNSRTGVFVPFIEKETRKSSIGNRVFVHHRILPAINRVVFVSGRVSYIVLRGRWSNIIFLNAHAPSEEKSDDSKTVFWRN